MLTTAGDKRCIRPDGAALHGSCRAAARAMRLHRSVTWPRRALKQRHSRCTTLATFSEQRSNKRRRHLPRLMCRVQYGGLSHRSVQEPLHGRGMCRIVIRALHQRSYGRASLPAPFVRTDAGSTSFCTVPSEHPTALCSPACSSCRPSRSRWYLTRNELRPMSPVYAAYTYTHLFCGGLEAGGRSS